MRILTVLGSVSHPTVPALESLRLQPPQLVKSGFLASGRDLDSWSFLTLSN